MIMILHQKVHQDLQNSSQNLSLKKKSLYFTYLTSSLYSMWFMALHKGL